jgi:serine phosphatase RsbU (regulator of sigma subunit)
MDMAICKISKKENEICFAGAKRPLFVVNEKGVREIKGSRFGIGGISSTEKIFEEHYLLANNQDTFYMSSDGFTDQFGGIMIVNFLLFISKENCNSFIPNLWSTKEYIWMSYTKLGKALSMNKQMIFL